MRTFYPSTAPNFHDTKAIAKAKWLQIERGEERSGRTPKSLFFPTNNLTQHDTKLSVIQKILHRRTDAIGVAITFSLVTAFDGSYVELGWVSQGGGADAGYVVYRDAIPLVYLGSTSTGYIDNTVESGETYDYFVLFHL